MQYAITLSFVWRQFGGFVLFGVMTSVVALFLLQEECNGFKNGKKIFIF